MARISQIRARRRAPLPPRTIDDYSDASSTYWPPGWSFERYRNAEQADIFALTDDEREKLNAGFTEVLGDDGYDQMIRIVFDDAQARKEQAAGVAPAQEEPPSKPDWLKTYERRGGGGREWGFVGFRTCLYDDEARWKEFKERLEQIAKAPFREAEAVEGVNEAAEKFTIRWEEDEVELKNASMETLQRKFQDLQPSLRTAGMVDSLFLLATPEAIDSVLSAKTPFVRSLWAPNPPWVFAAPACLGGRASLEEETDDWELWKELFRVAVEVLVDELWPSDYMDSSYYEITRNVGGYRWKNGEAVLEEGSGNDESAGGEGEDEAAGLKRGESELEEGDDSADNVWWSWMPNPYRSDKRRRVQ